MNKLKGFPADCSGFYQSILGFSGFCRFIVASSALNETVITEFYRVLSVCAELQLWVRRRERIGEPFLLWFSLLWSLP